jgi:dihydroxyacetone kinase-like predicted kinase
MVRVHLHSDDPEPVFGLAETIGVVSRAKAEDMSAQHTRYRASGSGAGAAIGVLALSPGPGFDTIFESLGVAVVRMGEAVKPAAGDIAAAANALGNSSVIVLPNHKNVVMAARQAVSLARCSLLVVATESMPQGIAAAIAFDAGQPADANVEDMEEARTEVATVEVTTAAADRTADGLAVREGDAIGLINGRLVARSADPLDALIAALNRLADDGSGLIALYGGAEVDRAALERARAAVQARFRGATVEAAMGGQPLYTFIASFER